MDECHSLAKDFVLAERVRDLGEGKRDSDGSRYTNQHES